MLPPLLYLRLYVNEASHRLNQGVKLLQGYLTLLAMLTRTLPLVSGAVTVPWIICHHCAVVKVGREHEHVVEDPLHHVLSLLLAAGVEG